MKPYEILAPHAGFYVSTTDTQAVAYEFEGFRLEPARRMLTRPDGTAIHLTSKPFDTLVHLVAHAGELFDRDALLQTVWPKRVVEDNNLNQAIATLRRALGEHHIVTVAGRGYQFVTPVHVVPLPPAVAAMPLDSAEESGAEAPRVLVRRQWLSAALVAAFTAGLAFVALFAFGPSSNPSPQLGPLVTEEPLTTYPGEELAPALSPDGTRVAFSWRSASGGQALYVTQVGGGEPLALTDPGEAVDSDPAWSPSGEQIAFIRRYDPARFDVFVVPALGGTARKVAAGEMYPISVEGSPLLAWTPAGDQLVFPKLRAGQVSAGSYGLHRLTLATGVVEDLGLKNEPLHYDTSPAISPDGQWLAFTRYTRSGRLNRVFVQRLAPGLVPRGDAKPVEHVEPAIYHSLHWNAASDRLWFSDGGQLFESSLAGVPRVVHTLGPLRSTSVLTIVQRGTGARAAVAVRRVSEDIFALPLDPVTHSPTGEAKVRVPSTAIEYHPRVSPDGKTLAFVSDRSGVRDLWLTEIGSDIARRLTEAGQLVIGYPRWSPDSKTIAFHSSAPDEDRVIYTVDVASGSVSRLFNGCCPGGWSADGKALYVTELGTVTHVVRVDVATGVRERLFEGGTAVESADGKFLLYSKNVPGYFRRALHTSSGVGEETRLVDDYMPSLGGLAPVVDGFFYVGLTPESVPRAIRFYDYARGEARDVVPVPATTAIGLTVSADGRWIFYAAVDGPPEADIALLEFAAQPEE